MQVPFDPFSQAFQAGLGPDYGMPSASMCAAARNQTPFHLDANGQPTRQVPEPATPATTPAPAGGKKGLLKRPPARPAWTCSPIAIRTEPVEIEIIARSSREKAGLYNAAP